MVLSFTYYIYSKTIIYNKNGGITGGITGETGGITGETGGFGEELIYIYLVVILKIMPLFLRCKNNA